MCLRYHDLVHPPCCSFSFCSLCFSCSIAIALCRGALTQSNELALYCSFVKQQFLRLLCCILGCDLVCPCLCKAKWDERSLCIWGCCLGLGMWECCGKLKVVSSLGDLVWRFSMGWEVGVSRVRRLLQGLGKHWR